MDLTPTFSQSLAKHGATTVSHHTPYNLAKINTFLQESYVIHARITDLISTLRQTRTRYLSTAPRSRVRNNAVPAPLSERERDAFDAQSKQLLRQLNATLKSLRQAEDLRMQTAASLAFSKRSQGGMLGRWASGGGVIGMTAAEEREEAARATVAAFREAVLMFLQGKLERASRLQAEMMEARLSREVEKSKSMLARSGVGPVAYAVEETSTAPHRPAELTEDQMQLFAAENSEMLKHYEDQLDQVRKAEKSILEISELHSQLHANLETQSSHIDRLVEESWITTENLDKGNKELKKASERRSTAQAVFFATLGFCAFLVTWDLVF